MKRLSYSDRLLVFVIIVSIIVVALSSYYVYSRAYSLAKLYYDAGKEYVSDEIYYVDVARRYLQRIFKVSIDYWNYSGKTDDDYYNPEHPPLGKYIIALSMLTCGDKPICWRIPGVIEASLIPAIIYMAYARLNNMWILAATSAALGAASDYILQRAGSVALLDIHVAFFTALAILAASRGKILLAGFISGLAASVKMSGAAAVLALLLIIYGSKGMEGRVKVRFYISIILASLSVYILVYAPLISYFGFEWFIREHIGAVSWHTTSRPPNGPPTSTPFGWIININPFYYSVVKVRVAAELNTITHLLAFFSSIVLFLLYLDGRIRRPPVSSIFYVSILAFYYMVIIAGNHTLYSFYGVHLTPAMGGVIAEATLYASRSWDV
ncbi:MAG: hypothetical protein F7C81_03570 [Desulfurococcales archaeon]|nr:hypothetical protein [Desulfurococcales archaeon]